MQPTTTTASVASYLVPAFGTRAADVPREIVAAGLAMAGWKAAAVEPPEQSRRDKHDDQRKPEWDAPQSRTGSRTACPAAGADRPSQAMVELACVPEQIYM